MTSLCPHCYAKLSNAFIVEAFMQMPIEEPAVQNYTYEHPVTLADLMRTMAEPVIHEPQGEGNYGADYKLPANHIEEPKVLMRDGSYASMAGAFRENPHGISGLVCEPQVGLGMTKEGATFQPQGANHLIMGFPIRSIRMSGATPSYSGEPLQMTRAIAGIKGETITDSDYPKPVDLSNFEWSPEAMAYVEKPTTKETK
ncbi:MAG: hypothetical protein V4563_17765 [Pseudomonadota bacterium]